MTLVVKESITTNLETIIVFLLNYLTHSFLKLMTTQIFANDILVFLYSLAYKHVSPNTII